MNIEGENDGFADFGDDDVEVGSTNAAPTAAEAASAEGEAPPKPAKPLTGAAKAAKEAKEAREAAAAAPAENDEGEEGAETPDPDPDAPAEGETDADYKKRSRLARENQIKRLKTERDDAKLEAAATKRALEILQNGGVAKTPLQTPAAAATPEAATAPDPNDLEKYPLGFLDEKYQEDVTDFRVNKILSDREAAALQRQQETAQTQAQQQAQQVLQSKVTDLTEKGLKLFEDFKETVVDTAFAQKWPLEQATFEAASEEPHGAQILYDLSQNLEEAERVAKLSPYQQGKYVQDKNAEYAAKAKPRTKPGAGAPPASTQKGAGSRVEIDPATDDLADFEKAWVKAGK